MKEQIITLLGSIVHPEQNEDIVTMDMVEGLEITPDAIRFSLILPKARDPLGRSVKKACEQKIENVFPHYKGRIAIVLKEPSPRPSKTAAAGKGAGLASVKHIIAVASGKGGVGKSTVTANLAAVLAEKGYRTGILDADVYGPSIPEMYGLEHYSPSAEKDAGGNEQMIPAEKYGVKVMSIGFFIRPDDVLAWRGPMATNALRQLIHQTRWGELDFLFIDMPPGTGDVHLTIASELKVTGAVIVSTPQKIALADVIRGIRMFQSENINIPIIGLVENMAWFTPLELPDNRYYIFGKEGCKLLARQERLPFLGEIPLVQGMCESGEDSGTPQALSNTVSSTAFIRLADNFLTILPKILK